MAICRLSSSHTMSIEHTIISVSNGSTLSCGKTVLLTLSPPLAQAAIALASEMTVEAVRGRTYSFDHFVPRPPSYVIEFDGSIYGLGGRVFSIDPAGQEIIRLELSLPPPTRIKEDDSLRTRVQNSCELLAALATLVTSLPSVGPVLLRGNSKVALSWMETDHFRSQHSVRTALVVASVSHRYGVMVVDTSHLAAADNDVCDSYPRHAIPTLKPGVLRVSPQGRSVIRFVNRKLPAPMQLLTRARVVLWDPEPATQSQRMTAMAYLVIILQYVTARRISNLTNTVADRARARKKTKAIDPDDKHTLTARDVLFASNEGLALGVPISRLSGSGTTLSAAFEWGGGSSIVIGLCLLFWTQKGGQFVEPLWIKRGRGEAEDQLLRDLLTAL